MRWNCDKTLFHAPNCLGNCVDMSTAIYERNLSAKIAKNVSFHTRTQPIYNTKAKKRWTKWIKKKCKKWSRTMPCTLFSSAIANKRLLPIVVVVVRYVFFSRFSSVSNRQIKSKYFNFTYKCTTNKKHFAASHVGSSKCSKLFVRWFFGSRIMNYIYYCFILRMRWISERKRLHK